MQAQETQNEELAAYKAALDSLDWSIESTRCIYTDTNRWLAHQKALMALQKMQKQLDPEGLIWMAHRPNIKDAAKPKIVWQIRIKTEPGTQQYCGIYGSRQDALASAHRRATNTHCVIEVEALQ